MSPPWFGFGYAIAMDNLRVEMSRHPRSSLWVKWRVCRYDQNRWVAKPPVALGRPWMRVEFSSWRAAFDYAESWAQWIKANHQKEAPINMSESKMTDDHLIQLMICGDSLMSRIARQIYDERHKDDPKPKEAPHCDECFEGCEKCQR